MLVLLKHAFEIQVCAGDLFFRPCIEGIFKRALLLEGMLFIFYLLMSKSCSRISCGTCQRSARKIDGSVSENMHSRDFCCVFLYNRIDMSMAVVFFWTMRIILKGRRSGKNEDQSGELNSFLIK